MNSEDHQTLATILDKLDCQSNLLESLSRAHYQTGNEFMGDTLGLASTTIYEQIKALENLRSKVTDDAYRASQDATGNMLKGILAVAQKKL